MTIQISAIQICQALIGAKVPIWGLEDLHEWTRGLAPAGKDLWDEIPRVYIMEIVSMMEGGTEPSPHQISFLEGAAKVASLRREIVKLSSPPKRGSYPQYINLLKRLINLRGETRKQVRPQKPRLAGPAHRQALWF